MLRRCAFCNLSYTGTVCPACKKPVCSQCSVTTFIERESVRLCQACNEKNEAFERGDHLDAIHEGPSAKKKKLRVKGGPLPASPGSKSS